MSSDLILSLSLIALLLAVLGLYLVRVLRSGAARYDRIDQQGGSVLLSQRVLEMGYWAIEPLARLLARAGVSAKAISWAAFALGMLSGALLALGRLGWAAGVAAAAGFLDALDGYVARATRTASSSGKMLDSTLDRYVEFAFLAGAALHYIHHPWLVGLSLLALLGSFMVSYSTALSEILAVSAPRGSMRRVERMVYLIAGATLAPISIRWLESSGVGWPLAAAIALVAVAANVSAARRLAAMSRQLDARDRLDRVPEGVIEGVFPLSAAPEPASAPRPRSAGSARRAPARRAGSRAAP